MALGCKVMLAIKLAQFLCKLDSVNNMETLVHDPQIAVNICLKSPWVLPMLIGDTLLGRCSNYRLGMSEALVGDPKYPVYSSYQVENLHLFNIFTVIFHKETF